MTKIQWTDRVWNPVTGCTKVSAGCKHCYAETIANRRLPHGGFTDRPFTEVRCHPDRLDAPLHWRKPCRVFVNSMSDLFHEAVPFIFINRCFARMNDAQQHTFQILTKRPQRMLEYFAWARVANATCSTWPLPNVWLGVSCEDQAAADERIPLLLQAPAAVRFLSLEPLLGPIDFGRSKAWPITDWYLKGISWTIVGGESGPKARPCDIAWIRDIVRQCRAVGVPCFVKQLGATIINTSESDGPWPVFDDEADCIRMMDRKGGDPSEWPEDLRVREFPA